ncbi:ParB/RepB/Spo0J family partition protein [Neoaquamicrobium sediminum]
MATGIKELAKGRSDQYRLSPFDLHTKEGWNARENDFNPEDIEDLALAQSIAEIGVKQSLTAYWEDGKAFVSDGHRRRAAAMYAIDTLGADREMLVPVVTENRNADEAERTFSMIVRNSGKPLTPIEQGQVFKRLTDLGWTESNIAKKAGISRVHVSNLIALVAAPKTLTDLVRSGEVSSTLAITTLNKHKGEAKAAAKELKEAVKEAKKSGKDRATAKHVRKAAEKKQPKAPAKSVKQAVAEIFERVWAHQDGDNVVVHFGPADIAAIFEITGLSELKFLDQSKARPSDDLV